MQRKEEMHWESHFFNKIFHDFYSSLAEIYEFTGIIILIKSRRRFLFTRESNDSIIDKKQSFILKKWTDHAFQMIFFAFTNCNSIKIFPEDKIRKRLFHFYLHKYKLYAWGNEASSFLKNYDNWRDSKEIQ